MLSSIDELPSQLWPSSASISFTASPVFVSGTVLKPRTAGDSDRRAEPGAGWLYRRASYSGLGSLPASLASTLTLGWLRPRKRTRGPRCPSRGLPCALG